MHRKKRSNTSPLSIGNTPCIHADGLQEMLPREPLVCAGYFNMDVWPMLNIFSATG